MLLKKVSINFDFVFERLLHNFLPIILKRNLSDLTFHCISTIENSTAILSLRSVHIPID